MFISLTGAMSMYHVLSYYFNKHYVNVNKMCVVLQDYLKDRQYQAANHTDLFTFLTQVRPSANVLDLVLDYYCVI